MLFSSEGLKPDMLAGQELKPDMAQTGHDNVRFELLSPELKPDMRGVKSGLSTLRRRARTGHERAALDLKPDT